MRAGGLTLTFDIFGTVLDWRAGLARDCAAAGRPLAPAEFDQIVDRQAEIEAGPYLTYSEITRRSLIDVIGLDDAAATRIGASVGHWPLYPDSARALGRLMKHARCVAMTNSDRAHGEQVQGHLGFRLSEWVCAEDVRRYKPDPAFWETVAARGIAAPGGWWHVSAYADYDLAAASRFGLTTVFVNRPHARPGPATHAVADLDQLADRVASTIEQHRAPRA
jgi:2-haloalkanoic acid dehalogenase type II